MIEEFGSSEVQMAETYESVLSIAETLSKADRRRLLYETEDAPPKERVSILELEGLGQELWEGIDTDPYTKAERDSWDR